MGTDKDDPPMAPGPARGKLAALARRVGPSRPPTMPDTDTTDTKEWTAEAVRVLRARLGITRREMGRWIFATGDGPGRMSEDGAYTMVRRYEEGERAPTAAVVKHLDRLANETEGGAPPEM